MGSSGCGCIRGVSEAEEYRHLRYPLIILKTKEKIACLSQERMHEAIIIAVILNGDLTDNPPRRRETQIYL